MADHIDLGKQGEEIAADWLQANGFTLQHRNWRFGSLEIDIIATKGKFLCFIEVKTRNFSKYIHPEDGVTRKKFKKLQRAADEYLFRHPGHPWIQYYIVAITLHGNREPEIFLIEDVFL